jgi:hypothetical protein
MCRSFYKMSATFIANNENEETLIFKELENRLKNIEFEF